MVEGAPTFQELMPELERILRGREVLVYNAEFDLRMMQQSHRLHGMAWDCRDAGRKRETCWRDFPDGSRCWTERVQISHGG